MTNCANCQASVFKTPLVRINAKGEKGIWWCEACIKTDKFEVYMREKEQETPVEKLLKEIFYG